MHPARAFKTSDEAALGRFVAERVFALVVGMDGSRPLAAHAPVLLSGRSLRFHLSSANPLTAALEATPRALVVVSGPDAYVSPDWYVTRDQVPTWNYVSCEVEGAVRTLSRSETTQLLDDLGFHLEARLAPKPPWSHGKMPSAAFEAMLSAITGFELQVERLEGTTKLSQNKNSADVAGVIAALGRRADAGSRQIADLMQAQAATERRSGLKR